MITPLGRFGKIRSRLRFLHLKDNLMIPESFFAITPNHCDVDEVFSLLLFGHFIKSLR